VNGDIEIRGLGVTFDGASVLEGLDLRVGSGEFVALVGPNGAGKTTFLRALLGLVPHEGSVGIDGIQGGRNSRRRRARRVAFVAQRPVIPGSMRAFDYVMLGRTPHIGHLGREGRSDIGVAREIVEFLDLAPFAQRRLGTLSGGELQRVVLARALAQEPAVLLLDEPTSALDIGQGQRVLQLVDDIRRERALTVVSAMHDLSLAGQFADVVVLLNAGKVVASGPPESVLTAERIGEFYGANVHVVTDPHLGVIVAPTRSRSNGEDPT
jgi:iron complex transport system ATP-binding protein